MSNSAEGGESKRKRRVIKGKRGREMERGGSGRGSEWRQRGSEGIRSGDKRSREKSEERRGSPNTALFPRGMVSR